MADQVLKAYTERYKLTPRQVQLLSKNLVQITLCQTEEARRLLLGVSE